MIFQKRKKKQIPFAPFKCVVTADGETYFVDADTEDEIAEIKRACGKAAQEVDIKIYKGDNEGAYFLQNGAPKNKIGFRL